MTSAENPNLFHLVGTVVAASQIFEVIFVLSARLALKQADIRALEDIEPVSESKAFKQPVKALLNELSQVRKIEPHLEDRVSKLVENRHRILHRSFLDGTWPLQMSEDKERDFRALCTSVAVESQAMSIIFVDLLLAWMKRFPATSETAIAHEAQFKELAGRIRSQSEAIDAA